jgi:predicted transcriptional regulator
MKEKRKIFLSFRPEFFRPILYDIKKYEYRKRFCDEPTTAYLYLSSPVKKVIGVMELGKALHMDEIVSNYSKESEVHKRIVKCLDGGEKFAIPIESFQLFKNPVPIEKIKEIQNDFSVPQCYLNLENYKNVLDFLKNQPMFEVEFYNKHDTIYESNLAMTCKEMELTDEFIYKDKKYLSDKKYDIVECGYINRKKGKSK